MNPIFSSHRPLVSTRIPELLDTLKTEFENLAHDVSVYKMQKDEYERKLTGQIGELTSIQNSLFELERKHNSIKQTYEEEILRLRRQLESASGIAPSSYPAMTHAGSENILQRTNGDKGGAQQPPPPAISNLGTMNSLPNFSRAGSSINTASQQSAPANPSSSPSSAPSGPSPNILNAQEKNRQTQFGSSANPTTKRPRDSDNFAFSGQTASGSGGFPALINNVSDKDAPPAKQLKEDKSAKDSSESNTFMNVLKDQPQRNNGSNNNNTNNTNNNGGSANSNASDRNKASNVTFVEGQQNGNDKRGRAAVEIDADPKDMNTHKKEGGGQNNDWAVAYNPNVKTNLTIDLAHNLDHASVVCCVRFSADGKYLATGCNGSAQIFDVETGEKQRTFIDESAKEGDLYVRSVCFSPDGRYLAAGYQEDKTIKLWDIEQRRISQTFVGHEMDIYSLDFSSDGRFVVSASGDKKVKIWDIQKAKCMLTLGNEEVGPDEGVTSVAISPNGKLVAAGSLDKIIRLWDAQTGAFLDKLEGHLDAVYSVAFSHDGNSLASGSLDNSLKLWDISRSRRACRSTFSGHTNFVLSVAFSHDGNWLISGSKDRSVQFWDPRNSQTHIKLQGHRNSVISVAVSPTGGYFATGSGDCRARIWKYFYNYPNNG